MLFKQKISFYKKVEFFFFFIVSFLILISNIKFKIINTSIVNFVNHSFGNILVDDFSFVYNGITDIFDRFKNITFYNDNINKLKLENKILKKKLSEYKENERSIANYISLEESLKESSSKLIYAKVLGAVNQKNKLIYIKTSGKVNINDLVIGNDALIGKVVLFEESNNIAKIQMLNDIRFNIPAMIQDNFENGMISNNDDHFDFNTKDCALFFKHYNNLENIQENQVVLTSGEFGLSKRNIPIGIVSSVDKIKNKVCIKPIANLNNLNNLVIVSND